MGASYRLHQLGMTTLSKHCEHRMQKRGIPEAVIDLLLDFGDSCPSGDGTEKFYFTKKAFRKVTGYLGQQAKYFEKYRCAYVIIGNDGTVVTASYIH
jgi:hypothetical protein